MSRFLGANLRAAAFGVIAMALLKAAPSLAQWSPMGVHVCASGCPFISSPKMIADEAGGAYVAWRHNANATDVHIQRITGTGTIELGWPSGGLPACTQPGSQFPSGLVADGYGGALLVWNDFRSAGTTSQDIYAQRILGDGAIAPGWPLDGAAATQAPGFQTRPSIASDGTGGAYIMWDEEQSTATTFLDVYAQHLTSDGAVAPGWPVNGRPIVVLPGFQGGTQGQADGTGGLFMVWSDERGGTYGQRLRSDGLLAPGWPEGGVLLAPGRLRPLLEPDDAGGFYLVTSVFDEMGIDREYHVQRIDVNGEAVAGWPSEGVAVCAAFDWKGGLDVAPDGLGGLLLAWEDYRLGTIEAFAARVLPDGSLPWGTGGRRVSGTEVFSNEFDVKIAPDKSGGAYVAWRQEASGNRILVQHLDASGTTSAGWPPVGLAVSLDESQGQFGPLIVSDASGGAIVAWEQGTGIYLQRFQIDGPVAVDLALQSAEADPDRVSLIWHGPGAGGLIARVERHHEQDDWRFLGSANPDGADRLSYEDRDVVAGERYAYRLVYMDEGIERRTPETWVDVPRALELALSGFRPNPARGAPAIAFTLPAAGDVRIEVLDVSGRRVWNRRGVFAAGRHTVALERGVDLAPGVYVMRLTYAGRVLSARGAVMD